MSKNNTNAPANADGRANYTHASNCIALQAQQLNQQQHQ